MSPNAEDTFVGVDLAYVDIAYIEMSDFGSLRYHIAPLRGGLPADAEGVHYNRPAMSRPDPIAEFLRAYEKAKQATEPPYDATTMTLATADAEGRPSARMVLLKTVDQRGFVFYTNYESRKAQQLDANPHAALTWHWPTLGLQFRAEGPVTRVSEEESDAYFASRPRGSQIGAWASKQSQPLSSRAKLVARVAATEARFVGREVPRPELWGGYLLRPVRMEIWHNQLHRLHDRKVYTRELPAPGEDDVETEWQVERLYP